MADETNTINFYDVAGLFSKGELDGVEHKLDGTGPDSQEAKDLLEKRINDLIAQTGLEGDAFVLLAEHAVKKEPEEGFESPGGEYKKPKDKYEHVYSAVIYLRGEDGRFRLMLDGEIPLINYTVIAGIETRERVLVFEEEKKEEKVIIFAKCLSYMADHLANHDVGLGETLNVIYSGTNAEGEIKAIKEIADKEPETVQQLANKGKIKATEIRPSLEFWKAGVEVPHIKINYK